MKYLCFDTETSGIPDFSKPAHADGQPRLASYAFLFVDEDFEIEHRVVGLIRPDGWEMPPEAQAVNGLSTAMLLEKGESVVYAVGVFREAIDSGRTLVAHNLSFDAKIMRGELRRANLSDENCTKGICTMRSLTAACAIPHPRGTGLKFPSLTEACRIIAKREVRNAHGALPDALGALWLLRNMHLRGLVKGEDADNRG